MLHPQLAGLAGRVIEPTSADLLAAADLVFLALPHEQSAAVAAQLPAGSKIVDLSASFRLAEPAAWPAFYPGEHAGTWTCGLPELPGARAQIAASSRVASPGCHATTAILALAPLLAAVFLIAVIIGMWRFGVHNLLYYLPVALLFWFAVFQSGVHATIAGVAIGMSQNGVRPAAEIEFADFAFPAFNQLVSEAARWRYRSNGGWGCPITVRMPYGAGIGGALYPADATEAVRIRELTTVLDHVDGRLSRLSWS